MNSIINQNLNKNNPTHKDLLWLAKNDYIELSFCVDTGKVVATLTNKGEQWLEKKEKYNETK